MSHRAELSYTEAVLHESMRLASVAPTGVPHMTTCDTSIGELCRLILYPKCMKYVEICEGLILYTGPCASNSKIERSQEYKMFIFYAVGLFLKLILKQVWITTTQLKKRENFYAYNGCQRVDNFEKWFYCRKIATFAKNSLKHSVLLYGFKEMEGQAAILA